MNFKIDANKTCNVFELIDDINDRLYFINSELECPLWMLGNRYRYILATEKRELENKLKRIYDEYQTSYL